MHLEYFEDDQVLNEKKSIFWHIAGNSLMTIIGLSFHHNDGTNIFRNSDSRVFFQAKVKMRHLDLNLQL